MKVIHDFGFAILEIAPAEPHDNGVYMCVAKNRFGEDRTQCTINVDSQRGVSYEWQLPEQLQREKITELEESLHRVYEPPAAPDKDFDKPVFVEPLQDLGEQTEGDAGHFQCKLEPIGDPSLRIQWLHNGKPIPYSSRIHTQHDFGYVILDIKHLIPEDSGEYICRATNSKGVTDTIGHINCRYRCRKLLRNELSLK